MTAVPLLAWTTLPQVSISDCRRMSPRQVHIMVQILFLHLFGSEISKQTKQGIIQDEMEWLLARNDSGLCLTRSCALLFFQWSCAYDDAHAHDVHDETGSTGRVSRLVTVPTDPFTRPTAHFCLNGRSTNPETPKMGKLYFRSLILWQILNQQAQFPIRVS